MGENSIDVQGAAKSFGGVVALDLVEKEQGKAPAPFIFENQSHDVVLQLNGFANPQHIFGVCRFELLNVTPEILAHRFSPSSVTSGDATDTTA